MSSDSDAPRTEGGEKTERMDRLRALLNKPIKIPESASADTEDADYAAAVAAAATPQGARTPMSAEGKTPKGAKAPVETPPAVKAAAEALDRLTEEEKEAVVEGSGPGKSRSRRTWADAYLAKPDKPLTPEEVRAELTVALKEQGADLRELVAKRGDTQEKSLKEALETGLEQGLAAAREKTVAELATRFDGRLDEQAASAQRAAAKARAEAERLQGELDALTTTAGTLRGDLDAARTATDAARETAEAATRKAATATTFAWVGIALAVVAAVVGVVV
ncbi:hypothetical protein [Promicromonospora sp. NPDC090134]|uniref:hypothetical protein n=1 Tax=Promicromonospora sp. NPDC090134 TaxID=3364408 RepID=UPI0037FAC3FD